MMAMKAIDIIFLRSPPKMRNNKLQTLRDRHRYAIYLLTEFRYQSFDISIHKTPREQTPWYELLVFLLLGHLPGPFLKYRQAVLVIPYMVIIMDGIRYLIFPKSPPLFTSFWKSKSYAEQFNTSWHQLLRSPLMSIGYYPLARFGRPFGLMGAFLVSGIAHGYASFPTFRWTGVWVFIIVLEIQALYLCLEAMVIPARVKPMATWIFSFISLITLSLTTKHIL